MCETTHKHTLWHLETHTEMSTRHCPLTELSHWRRKKGVITQQL